ncbi:hypothetical protein ACIO3O_07615 [Streptomyces sp. NPDC087440]|uniref:hypothetical protein n=1 Tax=Streptomyces sp. NPDC087440 TaxID=3365790 RepID=UPI00382925AC
MNHAKRALASAALALTALATGASAASAADLAASRSPEPPSVPVLTSVPLVTKGDDALSLRDPEGPASSGSLESSKDLASMDHLGSLAHGLDSDLNAFPEGSG